MLRIHFTAEDLIRTRVAASADPLWEIVLSLHTLQARHCPRVFQKWSREIRGRIGKHRNPGLLAHLLPLTPIASYRPDFLTPSETIGNLAAGIDAVMSTPPSRLRRELQQLSSISRLPTWSDELAAGKPEQLRVLGSALRDYHQVALAPYWKDIREQVDLDRMARGQILLDGGPERLLETLSPQSSWRRPVLEVRYPVDRSLHLDGRGLMLVPSFFCSTYPITLADTTLPPVLVYPIPQAGFPPDRAHGGLSALLRPTRVAMLIAARPGRSTTGLARLLNMSPSTVSYHASVLRAADLITSRRYANVMLHTTTQLGITLLRGRDH
ncbi:ArsR/SmtB family transcription factor [Streptomyces sp. SBT349]|uniref:ArsR/SmtB family transcription factor n=1 Tax=Streptomyces sp. SBT349 TaxID=1580539 RepID=UPI00069FB161|nr:winged helix-turn-helix domain-containing protein [Streptomyces sp. SBT349]